MDKMLELISMLEDIVKSAAPVPISKKSLVDVGKIDDLATQMRLALPREITQAQNIVNDKNRIISDAKKEAEKIINTAEKQREELINSNAILQEARRRAAEEINVAQQRSNVIRSYTQDFTDKMLSRVEELMVKDVNELRIARKTLNSGNDLQKPQQAQPQQQAQQRAPQRQQPSKG